MIFAAGPMVVADEKRSNHYTLIGVASFARSDCMAGPSGYARVTKVLDWIRETMGTVAGGQ